MPAIEDSGSTFVKGSVSLWLGGAKEGSDAAARDLFNRYYPSLKQFIRSKLGGFPTRTGDEEDLASLVMDTLLRRLRHHELDGVEDRQHLWSLLLRMTGSEVTNHRRRESRLMRDYRRTNVMPGNELPSSSPTPSDVSEERELREYLFDILRNEMLRQIAAAKLEGYSNEEIAKLLGLTARTVQRKVSRIYSRWEQVLERFSKG